VHRLSFRLGLLATTAVAGVLVGWRSVESRTLPPRADAVDSTLLRNFQWRSIGPDRGGRSIAVSGVKGRPREAYFGAVGGGLWKTLDAGENWAPVTDGQITSSSVGAVAVSESNPDIVYIGTGESCIRGNIMAGDGMYKSVDAGKTWTHIGFRNSENISKIRVHPTDPNIVWVAVFGRYGVPHDERGVYKTTDGGATWKKVLFRDGKTPAIDIVIDRNNPQVVYAALWEAYRVEYQMSSGGPGSGLFKSTDGGETWTELTRNAGLPSGMIGKISVAVSGADANRVYALIENENGGLFSSDDAGATWTLVNQSRNIRQRAFYFTHIAADPKDKNTVYALNVSSYKSTDGGKTLTGWGGGTHSDYHDVWIDPDDPQHIVVANDGGGAVSTQGGAGWSAQDFPTPQYYHVASTIHVPFHVCGAQQDGSTVCLPNETGGGGGRGGAAAPTTYGAGGSENGSIAPDPRDPDMFYAVGNNGTFMTRLNRRTNQTREIGPYVRMFSGEPAAELVERWQWGQPLAFSPADPKVLYTASQHVWRTTNGGQSWERMSPDLTRADPKTLGVSGGPITRDMNGPEVYATVFALGPSKRDARVFWAGSDDGLVHVTRDGGKKWTNITPPTMPEFGRVSAIEPSYFNEGTAYVAVKKPLLDDKAPYIFRTTDWGKTWTKIVTGIRSDDYVHVVREDSTRRGLLYAGTQHGVYMSHDDGATWQSLSLNLPDVPVVDLIVEDNDLAIATHGRGFYILDDIQPLRAYAPGITSAVTLFKPAAAIRSAGGASILYYLPQVAQSLTLEILDAKGAVIQTYTGAPPAAGRGGAPGAAPGGGGRGGRGGGGAAGPAMTAGLNRAAWDLRYPGATSFPGMILWGASTAGPIAAPGTYQVRLTVDGAAQTQPLVVQRHPLYADVSDADLTEQFNFGIRIRDKVTEANNAVINIRALKTQVADRLTKSPDAALKSAADALTSQLTAVEEAIYQVRNQSGQDPLNFPIKLNNRLASLLNVVNRGDGRPIANTYPIFEDLVKELKVQTDLLDRALKTELPAFNAIGTRLGLEPVALTPTLRM
jgi:photosystem II stability/assembly factor-like uncharacterized protein